MDTEQSPRELKSLANIGLSDFWDGAHKNAVCVEGSNHSISPKCTAEFSLEGPSVSCVTSMATFTRQKCDHGGLCCS